MANALYSKFKESLLEGTIDLTTDTIKAALVESSGYTPNLSTHEFFSSVSGTVGTAQTLGSKTVTNGQFDAADVTWTAVAGGSSPDYIVIYKDTGVAGTSPLIALIDTTTGVTLPVTTNGGDIVAQWGAYIFAL